MSDVTLQELLALPGQEERGQKNRPRHYEKKAEVSLAIQDWFAKKNKRLAERYSVLNVPDSELKQMAWKNVAEEMPGGDIAQKLVMSRNKFNDLKAIRDKYFKQYRKAAIGSRAAVEEALKEGPVGSRSVLPDMDAWKDMVNRRFWKPTRQQEISRVRREGKKSLTPEQELDYLREPAAEFGPPSKVGDEKVGAISKAITFGGRLGQGFSAGATKYAASLSDPEPPTVKTVPDYAPSTVMGGDPAQRMTTPPELGEQTGTKEIVEGVRVYGAKPTEVAKQFWRDPANIKLMFNQAMEYAWEAATSDKVETKHDLSYVLRDRAKRYKTLGLLTAIEELGASDPNVKTRGQEIAHNLIDSDFGTFGLEHENITRLVHEIVIDPTVVINPVKVIGAGRRILPSAARAAEKMRAPAKIVGGIEKAGRGVEKVYRGAEWAGRKATTPFRFFSHTDDLKMAGKKGQDLADLMELSWAESGYLPAQYKKVLVEEVKKIDKVTGFAPGQRGIVDLALKSKVREEAKALKETFHQFVNGHISYDDAIKTIPDSKSMQLFDEAVMAHETLITAKEGLRNITGMGQAYSEGTEQVAKGTLLPEEATRLKLEEGMHPAQRYSPLRQEARDPIRKALDLPAGFPFKMRKKTAQEIAQGPSAVKSLKPKSSLHRAEGGTGIVYDSDVGMQWRKDLIDLLPAATKSAELRALKQVGLDTEFWKEIPNTKKNWDNLDKITRSLSKRDGVEWVPIDFETGQTVGRIVDKPGAMRAIGPATGQGTIKLVTKPMAIQIKTITEALGVPADEAFSAVKAFRDYLVRPINKYARTMATTPNAMFAPRNGASAFGLGYLAHGTKIANPAYMSSAVQLTMLAAATGDKAARKKILTLPSSGLKTTFGEAADALEKSGLINQMELQLGYEMTGKGPLARVAKGAEKLTEHTPAGFPMIPLWGAGKKFSGKNAAVVTENFQHGAIYLGFLDDPNSALARAKAYKLTAKYAGDYRRLGPREQKYLKEGFFFYAWMRFIVPHTMTQLVENPKLMSDFAKVKSSMEREWGIYAPVDPEGIPKRHRGTSVTAPLSAQPPGVKKTIGQLQDKYEVDGQLPPIGSDQFALMTLEEPMTMGLYFIERLENTFGRKFKREDDVYDMLGPFVSFLGDRLGQDPNKLPADEAFTNLAGELTWDTRVSRAWQDIYELFKNNGNMAEANEMRLRYNAFRQFGPYYSIAEAAGAFGDDESKQIGMSPAIPGFTSVTPFRPKDIAAGHKKEAMQRIPTRAHQLAPEWLLGE